MAAALVFGAADGTSALGNFTGHVTGIWIANAILLALLLKHPTQQWVPILIAGMAGNIAADVTSGYSALPALFMVVSNLLEILIVAVPMRILKMDAEFARPNSLLTFYALSVLPAPALSALLVATAFHLTDGTVFTTAAVNWYAADALGLGILVPPLMTVHMSALKAMFRKDQLVETLLLIGVVLATIGVNLLPPQYPLAFLFFPAVILLTFKRGFAGGTVGLLLMSAYLLTPVLFGYPGGVLKVYPTREHVLIVQIFIAVTGFSVVLMGAALEQRRKLERGLAAAMERAEISREEALVAKDVAERASRTKSMFLANMSHELRTPLNAVIGFAEVMHAEMFGPLGDARYREYTDMIHSAGHHLLDLINDILDMSKIEAGKLEINRERIGINSIVEDGVELMRERATQAGITLKVELPATPLWADADKRAIKQILLNLLSNAIKFTPADGRVIARAHVSDGKVVLSVSDTGIGIPSDQLYRLGNPFVQLRNNAGATQTGTGLGLALVRALAQLHGGAMKIESQEGCGTTVSVEIPAARAEILAA
jgi:signal transduction histidine kinase